MAVQGQQTAFVRVHLPIIERVKFIRSNDQGRSNMKGIRDGQFDLRVLF